MSVTKIVRPDGTEHYIHDCASCIALQARVDALAAALERIEWLASIYGGGDIRDHLEQIKEQARAAVRP